MVKPVALEERHVHVLILIQRLNIAIIDRLSDNLLLGVVHLISGVVTAVDAMLLIEPAA